MPLYTLNLLIPEKARRSPQTYPESEVRVELQISLSDRSTRYLCSTRYIVGKMSE